MTVVTGASSFLRLVAAVALTTTLWGSTSAAMAATTGDRIAHLEDTSPGCRTLTFAFENGTADMTDERDAIRAAFGLWSGASALTFREGGSESAGGRGADITVSWKDGDPGDRPELDGPHGMLALTTSTAGHMRIDFDDTETWTSTLPVTGGQVDLVTVAAHEIGHAIGIGHSTTTDDLMYAYYAGPHRRLSADDEARGRCPLPR